ncbi:uncharacterized protein LOC116790615 [Chiroxiphia lanceolata]|uniref:uncharacterized protein LOC116790615 n=1 Tax=Chiroxiphia lanceolata TaxID=296741 RepID=UPI0013CEF73B|nr:uncharacterized protein LOC116790615 [Chiroxiphia lanceolata]
MREQLQARGHHLSGTPGSLPEQQELAPPGDTRDGQARGRAKCTARCGERQPWRGKSCQPQRAQGVGTLGAGGQGGVGTQELGAGCGAAPATRLLPLCPLCFSPRLCSITALLGTALLLLAPSSTQALSSSGWKGLPTDRDLDKEIIPGVDVLEERELSEEVKPGRKAVSRRAWHPPQVQVEPEEDRDHLHHPQDDARKVDVREPPRMLTLQVQNGPEEDRDHLYHS